jgi:3-phosphoshikimate 1-carboxyvinyltransferase
VSLNPTRDGFLDVLERMGARVGRANRRVEAGEPVGDVTVEAAEPLRGFDVPPEWLPRMIDEVPAWAVVAACARGRSRISGAAELRIKESDRLATLARNLRSLGIETREQPDGLEIEGRTPRGGTVDAARDHRIAMAMAVLGTRAEGPVEIREASHIETSFPDFERTLATLGGHAIAIGEER